MTREEAIDILDDNFTVINTHGHYTDEEVEQARQMAIEALEQLTSYERTINKLTKAISEQEPILDKIRAEIEEQIIPRSSYTDKQKKLVLEIIDKYREEVDCHSCKTEHDCYECEKYAESEEKQ